MSENVGAARAVRQHRLAATAPTPKERLAAALGGLFWAFAGAAICAAMAPLEPSLLEEGFHLHLAQRIVDGEVLYRDVITFTGPLPFELLALLFRIFGEEIFVARGAVAVLQGLACAATFGIARHGGMGSRVLPHAAAATVASAPVLLFPVFSLYFYTTLAFHLTALATYAAVRGVEQRGWALAAGALVACVALCKQTLGVALAIGLVLGVAACAAPGRRMRPALAVAAGGAAATLLTLLAFAWSGDLGGLYRCLVVLPMSLEESFDSPYVNFLPIGEFAPKVNASVLFYLPRLYTFTRGFWDEVPVGAIVMTQFFFALPLIALAGTPLRRTLSPLRPAVWLHGAALLALFTNLFPRSDWGHLAYVLPGAVVQLLLLGPPAAARIGIRRMAATVGVVLIGVLLAGVLWGADLLYGQAGPPSFGPRVPIQPVSEMYKAEGMPRVIRFLRTHAEPDEPIFVARAEPLVYFATDTRNPTPYGGVIPGAREQQELAIVEALERVRYVVISDLDQPSYMYYSDELPAVQEYLERHFDVPQYFVGRDTSWVMALERREDRGATAIDLFDRRGEAAAWIYDRRGRRLEIEKEPPRLATHFNRRPLAFLLGPRGGGIDFELEIPENAVFQADVGLESMVAETDFHLHPQRMDLRVLVARDGAFEELGSARVLARSYDKFEGRKWIPIEVDLSAYAGEKVRLRLEAFADHLILPDKRLSWWGSPRIASRSDGAARDTPVESD